MTAGLTRSGDARRMYPSDWLSRGARPYFLRGPGHRVSLAKALNRTVVIDGRACALARESKALSREALAALSRGPHSLSVATIKRAERGQPVYLETARRLAQLLEVPLATLVTTPEEAVLADPRQPPAICVLSFRWLGASPKGGYLAAGLTEDLMMRLCRWWFPVVATPRLEPTGDAEGAALDMASTLGVRYWVEGSVRRERDQVRVVARLVEAASARILWTQSYERAVENVLSFQQEVATRIVHGLGEVVLTEEAARIQARSKTLSSAWEMSLQGAWYFRRSTPEDNLRARKLLQEAVRIDRELPLAWYTLAMTYRVELLNRWTDDLGASLRGFHDTTQRFEEAHPRDAGQHVVAAYVRMLMGDRDGAADRVRSALEVEPNHSVAYSVLGQTLAYRGQGDLALEQFEMALRLRPVSPENWQLYAAQALAHFVEHRYEDTLGCADQAHALQPSSPVPIATRAVALSYLGEEAAATQAVAQLKRVAPTLTVDTLRTLTVSAEKESSERFFAGLQRAGL